MNKILYLIRHAKSSWGEPALSDSERQLNERGLRDAPLMGKFLKNNGVNPDLIITSTAARASLTAKIFANELNFKKDNIETDERIYDATTQALMNVIRNIDNKHETVLLFGHNPGLSNLANLLSDKFISDFPTCAIAGIKLIVQSWGDTDRHCGNIFLYEYPKKILK